MPRTGRSDSYPMIPIATNNRHRACAFFDGCFIVLRMISERDLSPLSLRLLPAGLLLLGPLLRSAR